MDTHGTVLDPPGLCEPNMFFSGILTPRATRGDLALLPRLAPMFQTRVFSPHNYMGLGFLNLHTFPVRPGVGI